MPHPHPYPHFSLSHANRSAWSLSLRPPGQYSVSIRASCAFPVLQPSGLGVLDPPGLNPSASRPTRNLSAVWSELWLKRSCWSNAGFVRSIRNTWRACETPDRLVPLSGSLGLGEGQSLHFCLGDRTCVLTSSQVTLTLLSNKG